MIYSVAAASCETCGPVSAEEFSQGKFPLWPVLCTAEVVRNPLQHPGCGGRLSLCEPRRVA